MLPSGLQILGAVLIPLLLAVGAGATVLLGKRRLSAALLVLACGAGFVSSYLVTDNALKFPPIDATQWGLYLCGVFVLAGLIDAALRLPAWARALLYVLAMSVMATGVSVGMRNQLNDEGEAQGFSLNVLMTLREMVLFAAVLSVSGAALLLGRSSSAGGMAGGEQNSNDVWQPATVLIGHGLVIALSCPVLALSGSALQLPLRGGAVGLGLLGALLAAVLLWRQGRRQNGEAKILTPDVIRPVMAVALCLWVTLLGTAYMYYELVPWHGMVMAGGLLLPWVLRIGLLAKLPWVVAGCLSVILSVAPTAVVLGLKVMEMSKESADSYGY